MFGSRSRRRGSGARVLQSLLYETRATDTPSYLIAALVVLILAALAAAGPGLRAAGVSPIMALRQDEKSVRVILNVPVSG